MTEGRLSHSDGSRACSSPDALVDMTKHERGGLEDTIQAKRRRLTCCRPSLQSDGLHNVDRHVYILSTICCERDRFNGASPLLLTTVSTCVQRSAEPRSFTVIAMHATTSENSVASLNLSGWPASRLSKLLKALHAVSKSLGIPDHLRMLFKTGKTRM